jgi:hypothetical protein
MDHTPPPDEKRYWLDDSRNVTRLVRGFYVVCALVVAFDVFVPKHGPFAIEHLVLIAKALRKALMRPEDYYDR